MRNSLFFLLFVPGLIFAWGAKAHQMIAKLALSKTRPATRHEILKILKEEHTDIEQVAIWMDVVGRQKEYRKLRYLHFINLPFGNKHFFPKRVHHQNALTAIENAKISFLRKSVSSSEKLMSLRILFHVIADIHQPLHTISFYSKRFPYGDKGGNLYPLPRYSRYHHLHQFWDAAGGGLEAIDGKDFFNMPCLKDTLVPSNWVQDSYQIAIQEVYFPPYARHKMQAYQKNAQNISKQQISKAACHLAAYLDDLFCRV
jgi:S1/P1 Nuclease